jgi:hypothetical protein
VCNCLIQFLLTVVLSTEERVYLVEYIFREWNRHTHLVQELFPEDFYLWGAAKSAVYRDGPHTLNVLKTAITAYEVGSKSFRPDIQKLCQMENAVRDI